MNFVATAISFEQTDDSATLSLADDERHLTHYVVIERSLDPTAKDVQLGLDGAYLEIDDQRHCGYGVVECATLRRNELHIKLFPESADRMEFESDICIAFDQHAFGHHDFPSILRLILGDRVTLDLI